MTKDGHGVDGTLEGEAPSNVLPLRRDWFGPHAELIPFGPRAGRRHPAVPEADDPSRDAGSATTDIADPPLGDGIAVLRPRRSEEVDAYALDAGDFWSESTAALQQPISAPPELTQAIEVVEHRPPPSGEVPGDRPQLPHDDRPPLAERRDSRRAPQARAHTALLAGLAVAFVVVVAIVLTQISGGSPRKPSHVAASGAIAGTFSWHTHISAKAATAFLALGRIAAKGNRGGQSAARTQHSRNKVRRSSRHAPAHRPSRAARLRSPTSGSGSTRTASTSTGSSVAPLAGEGNGASAPVHEPLPSAAVVKTVTARSSTTSHVTQPSIVPTRSRTTSSSVTTHPSVRSTSATVGSTRAKTSAGSNATSQRAATLKHEAAECTGLSQLGCQGSGS